MLHMMYLSLYWDHILRALKRQNIDEGG